MATFQVPGAALDVELSGSGGQAFVQLHGLTASSERDRLTGLDLGRDLPSLRTGARVLRYDARGHGRSTGRPVAADYHWATLASDLFALLDHYFPGEQVHGMGASMGCATLLHAATRDPARFSGLTLAIPPTAWEARTAKAEAYRASADLAEAQGIDAFIAAGRLAPRPPARAGLPEVAPQISEELLPWVLRGAAESDLPRRERLAEINVPVTVLAWTEDPAHPLVIAEELVRLLPDAVLHVAEAPEQVWEWPRQVRDSGGVPDGGNGLDRT